MNYELLNINYQPLTILFAYVLDLVFGDPRWFPHPVKGIGWLVNRLENPVRKIFSNQRAAGIIFFVIIVSVIYGLTWHIIEAAKHFNEVLGLILSTIIIYTTLSIKDLRVESMEVYRALKNNDIPLARKKLAMIVGRDTEELSKQNIVRATVETVAESIVDGIIAPLFYAFIGGAPLAIAYKTVNTLDSMIGYKNEKYKDFGWFSAKLDDIINFVPGIISGVLIPVASFFVGKNIVNSIRIIFCDGIRNMVSGIPESAVAGALEVQLGGVNFYNSVPVLKPFLGDNKNMLEEKHIKITIYIAYICSLLTLILGLILCLVKSK